MAGIAPGEPAAPPALQPKEALSAMTVDTRKHRRHVPLLAQGALITLVCWFIPFGGSLYASMHQFPASDFTTHVRNAWSYAALDFVSLAIGVWWFIAMILWWGKRGRNNDIRFVGGMVAFAVMFGIIRTVG